MRLIHFVAPNILLLTFLYHLHLHAPKLGVVNVPPLATVVLTSTNLTSHLFVHGDPKDGAITKTVLTPKENLDIDTENWNHSIAVSLTMIDVQSIILPSLVLLLLSVDISKKSIKRQWPSRTLSDCSNSITTWLLS